MGYTRDKLGMDMIIFRCFVLNDINEVISKQIEIRAWHWRSRESTCDLTLSIPHPSLDNPL